MYFIYIYKKEQQTVSRKCLSVLHWEKKCFKSGLTDGAYPRTSRSWFQFWAT